MSALAHGASAQDRVHVGVDGDGLAGYQAGGRATHAAHVHIGALEHGLAARQIDDDLVRWEAEPLTLRETSSRVHALGF